MDILQFLTDAHGQNGGVTIKVDPSAFVNAPEDAKARFIAPKTIVFRSAYDITIHNLFEEVMHVIQEYCYPGGIDTSVLNFEYEAKVMTDIINFSIYDGYHLIGRPYFPDNGEEQIAINRNYFNWIMDIANKKYTDWSDVDKFNHFLQHWNHAYYTSVSSISTSYQLFLLTGFLRPKN
ncbi:MAG: hypothetical protein ACK5IJ_04105 [Mangrovibacterium sp.]